MPPKPKFTRDEVAAAAFAMIKEGGVSALTARDLGARLGTSARPIFTLFKNMEEVKQAARALAVQEFMAYISDYQEYTPAFKRIGMMIVSYGIHEPELFKLLFMRDRSGETVQENKEELRPLLNLLQKNLNLSEQQAYLFHLQMWVYVHGIATMVATNYLNWDDAFVSGVLTNAYLGLKSCTEKGGSQA